MKRLLLLSLGLTLLLSAGNGFSQKLKVTLPDGKSHLKSGQSSIVGSYPQHVDWYLWAGAAWEAEKVQDITYNQLGDPLTVIWDLSVGTDTKTTYTYNNLRMPTLILEQNSVNGTWVDVSRSRVEYDAYNNPTLEVSEDYTGNAWVMKGGAQFQNEVQNGKLMKTTQSMWDQTSGQYALVSRTTYTYGTNNLPSTFINELYETGTWTNSTRVTMSWLANGSEGSMISENWENGNWLPFSKMDFTYGNYDSVTMIMSFWEADASEYTPMMRDISNFDSHGNLILQTSEMWMGVSWYTLSGYQFDITYQGNQATQKITKDWQGNTYVNSTKEVFSSFLNLGIGDPANLIFRMDCYPNPAKNELVVQYNAVGFTNLTFQLVDMLGKTIETKTPELSADRLIWNLSEVPAGFYMVRMTDNNGHIKTTKIIKQQ